MLKNGLYRGHVYHKRHAPFQHQFRYKVFTVLVDLDELDAPEYAPAKHTDVKNNKKCRFLSFNRWNVLSLHRQDHGPRDGSPIRPWIERAALEKDIDLRGGKIFMLTFPRLWGYIFNPLTLYFCYDQSGTLRAVLYQVKNTFGGQHGYLLATEKQNGQTREPLRQSAQKIFHVSPFIQMDCRYDFILREPDKTLDIAIHQFQENGKILTATWKGTRMDLTDKAILRAVSAHPFLGFKIIAGIHWEALKLWIKGAKYNPEPPPPKQDIS